VLDPETARDCIKAGAKFIVSPALNLQTIAYCRERDVAVMPGALTPTEIVQAWKRVRTCESFSCRRPGWRKLYQVDKSAVTANRIGADGGVTLATAAAFIKAGAAAIGVGADLVDIGAMRAGQPQKVTEAARAYVEAVRAARANETGRGAVNQR